MIAARCRGDVFKTRREINNQKRIINQSKKYNE